MEERLYTRPVYMLQRQRSTEPIMSHFPHSQHHHVVLDFRISTPIINCIKEKHWNFQEANWNNFKVSLDNKIYGIQPIVAHYGKFIEAIKATARENISGGRKENICCDGQRNVSNCIMTLEAHVLKIKLQNC